MEVKRALEGQYRAAFAMIRQCFEKCPDEVWAAGKHPRAFWRIAYHTLFYTHLYLMPNEAAFQPWEKHVAHARILWDDDETGVPPTDLLYSQGDLLDYLTHIENHLSGWLAVLDLDSQESGFSWYNIPKLDLQFVNLRHVGIHLGQLQELLYAVDIDLDWVSRR
jgi:hypothetical protein